MTITRRILVNFFYAQPVGHAIEALQCCLGHHVADPEAEIAVVLNAATATELARWCPFVSHVYAVDHPLLQACADSADRLAEIPREWDWVLDCWRRHEEIQLEMFPGMRDFYAASDRHLIAREGRTVVGADPPGYARHQPLRLQLPAAARSEAAARLAPRAAGWIALMPAGSNEPALYPSVASWSLILDALGEACAGIGVALIGKRGRDARTATSIGAQGLQTLLAHPTAPLDCFDLPIAEQLAIVEACEAFLAPHTGFGMAALAVGTPWLALSGARWFEYYFNHVPFRSIVPDTARFPSFSQFDALAIAQDGDDGDRVPSMTRARIGADLPRIVAAAGELLSGSLDYETALRDYFADLLAAHDGDPRAIWSTDGVHWPYVWPSPASPPAGA